ncbi:hypothetical protein DBIPINDM_008314 (plasmid) [Mesorhizobium sp. AR02]|uniref:hypothetical protein n=1 Tax=Mesorhizobium sp. AR02 TaxID=2865837 RepID=UPI00215F9540|nr:hypothetical protein [Mesorhizobium sp. AR02]UVK57373.1 hypothetical protein DBIPINDM_008314 [Mesorhizobium sp. AR02]
MMTAAGAFNTMHVCEQPGIVGWRSAFVGRISDDGLTLLPCCDAHARRLGFPISQ